MRKFLRFLVAVLALVGCGSEKGQTSASGEAIISLPFGKSYNYDAVLVTRVVDGDTLKLENGERVRLIGIDTPEVYESAKLQRDSRKSGRDRAVIQAMGKKSSDFTRKLAEGKRVRLEFDVEKRDRYNRLLAYVYLQDGTFVNAEIVRQGFASPYTFPPNVRHVELFTRLYSEARQNRRGLWKEE